MHLEARIGTKLSHDVLAICISKCILHSREYILTAYFTHLLLHKIMPRFTLFLTNLSLIALHATIQSRLNRYPQISLSQFILSEIDRPELFTFQIISNGLVDSFEAKDATIESSKSDLLMNLL
jgi:hypothetical protein